MNKYYCTGSLGDAFVNTCKLYRIKDCHVIHHTVHKFWHSSIHDIYSLADISVEFGEVRKNTISSIFRNCEKGIEPEPWPIFPKLEEPYKKFNLPSEYTVVVQKTGRKEQRERMIKDEYIKELIGNNKVVLLGTEDLFKDKDCIDLVGKTTLLKALSITAHAKDVHSYHGLFGFFPLSQKIPTTIYERSDRLQNSCRARILPEWEPYFKGFVK